MTPGDGDPRHGTGHGYNLGCRCVTCKEAHRVRMAKLQERRLANPIPATVIHGVSSTYVNYGCSCAACKKANSERKARDRASRKARGLAPDDPRHGTVAGYTEWGCRCSACREAVRLYNWDLRERQATS